MEGRKFIESIRLENILSYGPNSEPFPLEPLNVLIGANASGKSNLIEALCLLRVTSGDLQEPIREGGGIREWLWKGGDQTPTATVEVTIHNSAGPMPLRYRLSFTESGLRFDLRDEVIEYQGSTGRPEAQAAFYYRYQEGRPVLKAKQAALPRYFKHEDLRPDQSILSQRRDPDSYPELTYLAIQFERMQFYREWDIGYLSPARRPQRADSYQGELLEDASNLGLILSDLLNQPSVKKQLLERMRDFYPTFSDLNTTVVGGSVQIFFHEKGLRQAIPATRLSHGSLRYLFLLAALCHPLPPPVMCIEEPELGLHPDIIPEVAKLLVEASERTQIFVTTHSDVLVDALTDVPEAIVVCEKEDGATRLQRLDPDRLAHWLEKYRLGDLWSRWQIGGNRW